MALVKRNGLMHKENNQNTQKNNNVFMSLKPIYECSVKMNSLYIPNVFLNKYFIVLEIFSTEVNKNRR